MLSPSQIAYEACKLSHIAPDVADFDTHCAYCGSNIVKGEHVGQLKIKSSFTNSREMADCAAPYQCNACDAILSDQRYQKALSACVFTQEGVYPANKKIHRGYWLMNPPKPPYIYALGVTKSQHVIWRSPVNLSTELILMQHGDDTLKLRRGMLIDAVNATQALREAYALKYLDDKKKPIYALMPFTYSDMKGQRVNQSEPQLWLKNLLEEDNTLENVAQPLFMLSPAECWALDFCLTTGLEKPEPLSV